MSTRSRIGFESPDGTVRSIYCHSDGYPSHNGAVLTESYTQPNKINELLNLGDISVLNENIGEKHDFDYYSFFVDKHKPAGQQFGSNWDAVHNDPEFQRLNSMVKAYGRDRGEENVEAKVDPSADDMYRRACDGWEEYAYLFRDGQWFITSVGGGAGPFMVKANDPEGTQPPNWRAVSDVLAEENAEKELAA